MPGSIELVFKILSILGFWKPKNYKNFALPTKILRSGFVSYSLSLSIFIAQLNYIFRKVNNLEQLSDALFFPITVFGLIMKLSMLVPRRVQIKKLLNELSEEILFKPTNDRQRELLKIEMDSFKKTYIFFLSMGLLTVFLWCIFPFLETNTANNERGLPVSACYPFNLQQTSGYVLAFIHQFFAIGNTAILNISIDCLLPGFMAYVSSQLGMLAEAHQNIWKTVTEDLKLVRETSRKKFEEKMSREQIRCIKHHVSILQLSYNINKIFNPPTLGQLALSIFTICITLFELTLVSPLSIKFFSMIVYQICMLMEVFLFCWYGNDILLKSSELLTAIYKSDWADCSISYKRSMVIMMIRTHRPIKLYAGNLFTLSLEVFVKILRSSWSYFAVLQSVQNR